MLLPFTLLIVLGCSLHSALASDTEPLFQPPIARLGTLAEINAARERMTADEPPTVPRFVYNPSRLLSQLATRIRNDAAFPLYAPPVVVQPPPPPPPPAPVKIDPIPVTFAGTFTRTDGSLRVLLTASNGAHFAYCSLGDTFCHGIITAMTPTSITLHCPDGEDVTIARFDTGLVTFPQAEPPPPPPPPPPPAPPPPPPPLFQNAIPLRGPSPEELERLERVNPIAAQSLKDAISNRLAPGTAPASADDLDTEED